MVRKSLSGPPYAVEAGGEKEPKLAVDAIRGVHTHPSPPNSIWIVSPLIVAPRSVLGRRQVRACKLNFLDVHILARVEGRRSGSVSGAICLNWDVANNVGNKRQGTFQLSTVDT